MNRKPLVSAIVSIYNSELFIKGKIEDLLAQTIAQDIEIILINSGSQQNEDQIIKPYLEENPNIKYLKTENRETIYKAWNRGIRMAEGKFITNSNTDDRLKKDAFEILAGVLEKNPEVGLVFANQYISQTPNEKFDEITEKKVWPIPDFNYFVQLDRAVVLSQPMWRSSIHSELGIWFAEEYEICGDHNFNLRLMKHYEIKYLPQVLGLFYVDRNKTNKSLQNMSSLEKEKLRMTEPFIKNYVDSLSHEDLKSLKNEFQLKVLVPIYILRAWNLLQKSIIPRKHPFTHEFIYFVYALVSSKLGFHKAAVSACKKLLKRRNSERVESLLSYLVDKK